MPLYKNKNIYLIFANTLIGVMSVSVIIPALPVIAREFSLSSKQIGLILVSYTLPGVLFGLAMGILADRYGRKVLIIPSLVIFGVAGGSIYWMEDFFWINVMRFVQGIGGAILPSMSTVLIGDLFEPEVRLKVMGINAAVLSVGTAFFPFLGGILAESGWNLPFLVFWVALPLAVLTAFFLDESGRRNHLHITAYFRQGAKYFFNPHSLLVFITGSVIFILLYGGILTYLTLYMDQNFEMSSFKIGSYIATASFATALPAAFSQTLERAMGRKRMMVVGFILFGASFLSILPVQREEWLLGSILIFGAAMGMTVPLLQSMVTELAPTEHRGFMVSMLGTLVRLGQTLGPALLACVLYFGDIRLIFIVCAIAAFAFAVMLLFLAQRKRLSR